MDSGNDGSRKGGGRVPRHASSAQTYRQRRSALLFAVLGLGLLVFGALSLLPSAKRSQPKPHHPTSSEASSSSPTTMPVSTVPSSSMPTVTSDPGLLPQSDVEPPIDASLTARLAPLWSAITTNNASAGLPVFFPKAAYLTMKTGQLPDPASDYASRLLAFYGLDVPAYHQVLASTPARLLSVNADASMAHWVSPGSCENAVGYWHLPGLRLVYSQDGITKSFAVASLISWRGLWYVVHLGPNPRPTNVGTVDQAQEGSGTPGPAGGC